MNFISKIILSIVLLLSTTLSAQLYLDFGKETYKVSTDASHRSFYHFKGGQNAEILEYRDFSKFSYKDPIIGLERSDMHPVHSSNLGTGFYFAKYSTHGKYIKHIYVQSSKNNRVFDIQVDSNNFYVFMLLEDSIKIKNNASYVASKKEYALLKFNRDLEFIKATYFDYDTAVTWAISVAKNKIILCGVYSTALDLLINGNSIKLAKPVAQYPNTNSDHILLSFDTNLNYENYGSIESLGNTRVLNIQITNTNEVSIAFTAVTNVYYGKDTIHIQEDINPVTPYKSNPAFIWLDKDLKLKRSWAKRDGLIEDIPYASFSDNGNIACGYLMQHARNIYIYRIELRDSTGKFITQLETSPFSRSSTVKNTPEAVGNYFSLITKNITWIFPDTTIFTKSLSRILVTGDSLKLVEVTPFGNDFFIGIGSQGEDYIFGLLQFSHLAELDSLNGKQPSYKIGTELDIKNSYYGIFKYTRQCIPVKAKILYDTMTNCAEEYGMFGEKRGSMQVEYEGTGAAFQWFMDPKFETPLDDMESTLQGGIEQKGTHTNWMTRTFGYTEHNINRYLVKVNGACTEPYFLDTIYHQVWGAPVLRPTAFTIMVKAGDSAVLTTYLNDLDYPMDSLSIQWYKGSAAVQDGSKYNNSTTQNLTIYSVNPFDAVTYTCKVSRIHCRDRNTQTPMTMYLRLKDTKNMYGAPKLSFTVYPNPAKKEVRIEPSIEYTGSVVFTNALGQKIETTCIENKINTDKLPTGVYLLSFEDKGYQYTSKIIIE